MSHEERTCCTFIAFMAALNLVALALPAYRAGVLVTDASLFGLMVLAARAIWGRERE